MSIGKFLSALIIDACEDLYSKGSTVFRPLSDNILIEPLDAPERSKGGIILPDIAKERPAEGKVVAVGPGRVTENGTRVPPDVKKGDRVIYGKYAVTELVVDGHHLLTVREGDILAVVED
jgi:chaperonin GroES